MGCRACAVKSVRPVRGDPTPRRMRQLVVSLMVPLSRSMAVDWMVAISCRPSVLRTISRLPESGAWRNDRRTRGRRKKHGHSPPHLRLVDPRAQSSAEADHVVDESDPPCPTDAYGRSKLAAEEALRASGVPFTILRPVLVYGAGVKGNLARLMRLSQSPWPLPFGL